MKGTFRVAAVILIALFPSVFAQRSAFSQIFALSTQDASVREVNKTLVVPKGTNVVLRLAGELSTKQTPEIIVVQDIVIDGVKVIARGAPVGFVVGGKEPGLMNLPGTVMFEVTGVVATSGDVVPLTATQSEGGETPCYAEGCAFLPLLFWKHGDPGKIEAGLLFTAKVTDEVVLNRELLGRPSPVVDASASVARLYLYQIVLTKPAVETNPSSDFFLDGKRVGHLFGNQYACLQASPGAHVLRVGHEKFTVDIDAHQERYIRVMLQSDGSDRFVDATDGYELGAALLKPGRFRESLSCFESVSHSTTHEHWLKARR